jgi:hypothetical protein
LLGFDVAELTIELATIERPRVATGASLQAIPFVRVPVVCVFHDTVLRGG